MILIDQGKHRHATFIHSLNRGVWHNVPVLERIVKKKSVTSVQSVVATSDLRFVPHNKNPDSIFTSSLSRKDLLHDVSMYIRGAEVAAGIAIGEFLVVQA